jgi:hypothetical protein
MTEPKVSDQDSQLGGAGAAPRRPAIAAAVVCGCLAVAIAAATVLLTFGLSESYGFGPVWDMSAFVMTVVAAALTGLALLGAVRLAGARWRALPVMLAAVVGVLAAGYVAGVVGNSLHH